MSGKLAHVVEHMDEFYPWHLILTNRVSSEHLVVPVIPQRPESEFQVCTVCPLITGTVPRLFKYRESNLNLKEKFLVDF